MNVPIVNDAFKFVRYLYQKYLPVGFRDLQLDQGMELKNLCTSVGLRKGLKDDEIEILALAAILHNTGSIEGEFDRRMVSQTIAGRYLTEKAYPTHRIEEVLACIAATQADYSPQTNLACLIQTIRFSNNYQPQKKQKRGEVGDLWP